MTSLVLWNQLKTMSPVTMAKYVTDGRFMAPAHIRLLNKKLLDVASGRTKRLIVSMPPRHGKSELISKYFPAWFLGAFPDKRVIIVSYQSDFAASWGMKTKMLLEENGKEIFGIKLSKHSKSNHRFDITNHSGGLNTAGIGGAITGKGADILIIDDPVKNESQAFSQVYRDKVYDWYRATALTRLEPDGTIILVMTRWHHDDLAGRIIKEEPDEWEQVKLPAVAKDDDVLGRQPGEALWPERYSIDRLEKIRKSTGSYWFSALYQQQPIAGEYQIFSPDYWKPCKLSDLPQCALVFQAWDTAFKDKEQNDFSVCITAGIHDGKIYILDMYRKKPTYPVLKRMALELYNIYTPYNVGIEDAGSGQSLIQDLKHSVKELPIRKIKPMSKEIRAHLTSPIIEAGHVYLPVDASWCADLMNEVTEFPKSRHDDIVDALCMVILELYKKIEQGRGSSGSSVSRREKKDRSYKSNFLSRI